MGWEWQVVPGSVHISSQRCNLGVKRIQRRKKSTCVTGSAGFDLDDGGGGEGDCLGVSHHLDVIDCTTLTIGLKVGAFGFNLNGLALTLSLTTGSLVTGLELVSLSSLFSPSLPWGGVAAAEEPAPRALFALKGGIFCITMGMRTVWPSFFRTGPAGAGFGGTVELERADCLDFGAGGEAGGGLGIGVLDEWLMPIERAATEAASRDAFSRICLCFSSSLARMTTRSSGIGLFS